MYYYYFITLQKRIIIIFVLFVRSFVVTTTTSSSSLSRLLCVRESKSTRHLASTRNQSSHKQAGTQRRQDAGRWPFEITRVTALCNDQRPFRRDNQE